MLYNASTPEEYFEQLEQDWRKEKLMEVRQLIQSVAPELTEGIEYKMLCYQYKGTSIFNLNAQMNYVSFYVGDLKKVDGYEVLLKPFNVGKGCIRIRKTLNLEETELKQFIENAWRIAKAGGDIGC